MKSKIASVALGLALGLTGSLAAVAGDFGKPAGSIKDHGTPAVPVPAPLPVPEYTTGWYLRGDIGYAFGSKPSVMEDNLTGFEYDWRKEDNMGGQHPRFGIGLGYQFRPWLRGDVTFDVRDSYKYTSQGSVYYDIDHGVGILPYRSDINDHAHMRNFTGLVNVYWDMFTRHGFTPYIGAGVGVVMHTIKRNMLESMYCIHPVDCDLVTAGDQPGPLLISKEAAGHNTYSFALATALMAGASWALDPQWKVDVGYRFMHLTGTDFGLWINGRESKVHIDDQDTHEVRIGLRYDIR